jgi:hypothetical protein
MLKVTTTLLAAFVLFLGPTLSAQMLGPATPPQPPKHPCATAVGCSTPEPGNVSELVLCLAGIGTGCWLLRRKIRPVQ